MLSHPTTPEIPSLLDFRDDFLRVYGSYCALSELLSNTYGASTSIEPHAISNLLDPINAQLAHLGSHLNILVKADTTA